MPAPGPGGEVVVYEGSPLERVNAAEIAARRPELLVRGGEQVYLAGEVVVGDYGVAGCLIVDAHPEQRLVSYEMDRDGWYPSYPGSYEEYLKDAERNHLSPEGNMATFDMELDFDNPEHFARFVGTAGGFKVVRAFLTPRELKAQMDGLGKFVGPAVRQECFSGEEVTLVPNEERMEHWPGQDIGDTRSENWHFDSLMAEKLAALEAALGLGDTNRDYYVSFHGWPWHKQVMDLAQASLQASIARVDQLLGSLDRRQTIATRGLGELANSDTRVLEAPEPQDV